MHACDACDAQQQRKLDALEKKNFLKRKWNWIMGTTWRNVWISDVVPKQVVYISLLHDVSKDILVPTYLYIKFHYKCQLLSLRTIWQNGENIVIRPRREWQLVQTRASKVEGNRKQTDWGEASNKRRQLHLSLILQKPVEVGSLQAMNDVLNWSVTDSAN